MIDIPVEEKVERKTPEIKNDKKKFSKNKIIIILFLLVLLIILHQIFVNNYGQKNIYGGKLKDVDIVIFNAAGDKILQLDGNDGIENAIIVFKRPNKSGTMYKIVAELEDGSLVTGFVKGKYINKSSLEKLENYDMDNIDGNIAMVNSTGGVYVRQNKIVEKNADDAVLISKGTYVFAGLEETSSSNSYTWKKIAYFEDGKAKTGYMVSQYLLDMADEISSDLFTIEISSEVTSLEVDEKDTAIEMKVVIDSEDNKKEASVKLRKEPGTSSKVLAKVVDGSTVYTTQNYLEESKALGKVDDEEWLKVILESGDEGYIAKSYVIEYEKVESQKEFVSEIKEIYSEGEIEGFTGIDVAPRYLGDVGEFEKMLNGTSSSVSDINVNFAYIRIGATAYGDEFKFVGKNGNTNEAAIKADMQIVRAYIRKCEQYKIPYGLYYFSQAVTEEEAIEEIEYIKQVLDGMGVLKYNVLPFALDVEKSTTGTRLEKYASTYAAQIELTTLKQSQMQKLSEAINQKVIMYTDHHALNDILSLKVLTDEWKQDLWMVDCGQTHSDDILEMKLENFVTNRQLVQEEKLDVNFMNYDTFLEFVQ